MKSPGSMLGFNHSQPRSLNHCNSLSVQLKRSRLIHPASGYICLLMELGRGLIEGQKLTLSCSLKYCSKRGAVPVITARPPSSGPLGSWPHLLARLETCGSILRAAYEIQETLDAVRPVPIGTLI